VSVRSIIAGKCRQPADHHEWLAGLNRGFDHPALKLRLVLTRPASEAQLADRGVFPILTRNAAGFG
jgi:hypothetical protein